MNFQAHNSPAAFDYLFSIREWPERQTGWAEEGSKAGEATATRKQLVIKRRKNNGLLSKVLCFLCKERTRTFQEIHTLQVTEEKMSYHTRL